MNVRPDVGLERLIQGLEQELLAAPDEEFEAGARDLGMKPDMKGSAAFAGVKNYNPQLLAGLPPVYLDRAPREAVTEEAADAESAPERPGAPKRNADA